METRTQATNVNLARNWRKDRVLASLDKKQTFELVRFLNERYTERFFRPIECLRRTPGNEQGYGFAIMALCCLLVETIECYREGFPDSDHCQLTHLSTLCENSVAPTDYKLNTPFEITSEKAFIRFFNNDRHKEYLPDVDGKIFYRKIRCGLLHQAQTKGTWRLVRTGKYWDADKLTINRDEFAERLRACFDSYLNELKASDSSSNIWMLAQRKIWWLAQLS